jgi:hypothetical protein
MSKTKNILVCPMDWGLGHATRMVPVIEMLKQRKVRLVLGADNRPYEFLKNVFPNWRFSVFPVIALVTPPKDPWP